MIWSKIGDIWRVKTSLLVSQFMFTAFSGGCGGAQSLSQLCVRPCFPTVTLDGGKLILYTQESSAGHFKG